MTGLAQTHPAERIPSRMAQRWMVFDHSVEGLFLVALRGRLSPATEEKLRRAGLDLSKKLQPAYPFEVWKQCLEIVATDLYPSLPRSEAWQKLGRAIVDGMSQRVMGRAMVRVSRLLGPLRALRRLDHILNSADNYVEARVTERSPTCVDVWINEVMGQPSYYKGILEASLVMTGTEVGQVEVLSREGSGATFRVSWEE
ncbi:MAG TPA: DUF2378 family protein [Hyalangium sp.]|jgi:uncharacterized protein (TIGR02265 family)|nr:DUF2378 family protein [Hyalangium sp.]